MAGINPTVRLYEKRTRRVNRMRTLGMTVIASVVFVLVFVLVSGWSFGVVLWINR